jgi:phosphatidate phosphatase LPIN
MSPDRLFTSFHREVIMRKPEVFKMACLKDIQRLFGGRDPFYAGFGNRITDAISYRSVNVPSSRIFTIDTQGDLKLELLTGFKSSYIHLNDLVDQMFPPINKTIHEEYNDFNYWKSPMPEIDIPELDEEGPIPTSPKPKPIKPDPNALPKESVLAFTPKPKRGILGSFTSRSSTTSIKSSPSRSPSISSITSLPPNIASSASTPTNELHRTSSSLLSSPPTSPLSLPADDLHEPVQQQQRPRSASSGIMSKVIGGVFSRKSTVQQQQQQQQQVIPPVIDEKKPEDDEEEEEDELYNAEIDDIDLDDIPFI